MIPKPASYKLAKKQKNKKAKKNKKKKHRGKKEEYVLYIKLKDEIAASKQAMTMPRFPKEDDKAATPVSSSRTFYYEQKLKKYMALTQTDADKEKFKEDKLKKIVRKMKKAAAIKKAMEVVHDVFFAYSDKLKFDEENFMEECQDDHRKYLAKYSAAEKALFYEEPESSS